MLESSVGDNPNGTDASIWKVGMVRLRGALQSFARRRGVEIRKIPASNFTPAPVFHIAVQLQMAKQDRPLRFVQVGANDGMFGDPLREYITTSGWTGVLIEPQPEVFELLKKNYRDYEAQLAFENVAISGGQPELTLYQPPERSGEDPTYARSVVSADPKTIARQLGVSTSSLRRIVVPCVTLNAMFRKHEMGICDVLQIDAEGFDWFVLQTLDLAVYAPTIIQFEIGHLTVDHCDQIARYVSAHDYDLYWAGRQGDGVAIRRGLAIGH